MISRLKARKRMIAFANKYAGRKIEVNKLSDKELYDFILVHTYISIDALLGGDSDVCTTLDRAIEKANSCKRDNYIKYREDNKNLVTQFLDDGEIL